MGQEGGFNPEAKMVGGLFNKFCGASTAQPTCTCPDASTFTHPYYFAYCAETSPAREGEEPTSCTCPSGAAFPANQEELTAMMGQERRFDPEAKMVGGLFNMFCGSFSSQPTCTCPDASTFTHPYYFAYCAETSPAREGEEPTSCTCPSGAAFPANQEELTAMMGQERGFNPEAKMVGGLFNKFCGSSSSQPTCTCPDASTFTHPYYFAYCAETSPAREGEEPT